MTKNINSLKSLSDITNFMHKLLEEITTDLEKSSKGNKAASQRVRTGTVKLEKVAKLYRKESIVSEKHPSHKSKAKKAAAPKHKAPAHKSAAKSHAPAKKPAAKAHASHSSHPSHGKSHATHASAKAKTAVKHKAATAKKPTAKLPARSR